MLYTRSRFEGLYSLHTVIIKILFVIHQHSLIWLSVIYYDYIVTILLNGLGNYVVPYFNRKVARTT